MMIDIQAHSYTSPRQVDITLVMLPISVAIKFKLIPLQLFRFSVYYFLIGAVIDGMCGGISTFLFASFAYTADISNEEMRTKRISLAESMVYLGGFLASVIGTSYHYN